MVGLTLCGAVQAHVFEMPLLLLGCGYRGGDAVWCDAGTCVCDAFINYRLWVQGGAGAVWYGGGQLFV
jgi:hypothetical protein